MARKVLLGIGILLTMVGLSLIATDNLNFHQTNTKQMKQKASREEIINKAKELGMKFPNELSKKEIQLQAKRVGLKLNSKQQFEKGLSLKSNDNQMILKKEIADNKAEKTKLNKETTVDEETKDELKTDLVSDNTKVVSIEIQNGATANQAVQELYQSGIIDDKQVFLDLIRKINVDNKILAGEYEFNSDTPLERVLLKITGNGDR